MQPIFKMGNFTVLYFLLLFLLTFTGGSLPVFYKRWEGKYLELLLAFSAAFLLGITLCHLLPDGYKSTGFYAFLLLVAGYFSQQLIQRLTQGMEHGHSIAVHNHHSAHGHTLMGNVAFWPVFWGLAIHAFSEGLPLGIHYPDKHTLPALAVAIGLHKIPEAMLVVALFLSKKTNRLKALLLLAFFAAITPLSGWLAGLLGNYFETVAVVLQWCIPFVAGIFIQIAFTIFYEMKGNTEMLYWQKWLAILGGIGVSLISLL